METASGPALVTTPPRTGTVKELTGGLGAECVLECVGTQSMMQAIRSTRPGGYVSYVGVPHGVELGGQDLFFRHVHLHGGPAPVRRYLPELIDLVWKRNRESEAAVQRDTTSTAARSGARSSRSFTNRSRH